MAFYLFFYLFRWGRHGRRAIVHSAAMHNQPYEHWILMLAREPVLYRGSPVLLGNKKEYKQYQRYQASRWYRRLESRDR